MIGTAAPFAHVLRLTDDVGIFEHALGSDPRRHLGYCLDDVARALVVVTRQPAPSAVLQTALATYLEFVVAAQVPDGRFHNRLGPDRDWQDEPGAEDHWGRALWALGTVAARSDHPGHRRRASEGFATGARLRSPFPRSMAYAALGASELLSRSPDDGAARALLSATIGVLGGPASDPALPWPEPRLTYGNAALPEALLAAGEHLGDAAATADGLALLGWLLEVETRDQHLSVTPVGGWGPGEHRPGFDQQPIEVAALADACARAYRLTGEDRWARGLRRAVAWFGGDNDTGVALTDATTGGGHDGLHVGGRNDNQGAESTLAMVSTLQWADNPVRP
jgi:hypothetical protein